MLVDVRLDCWHDLESDWFPGRNSSSKVARRDVDLGDIDERHSTLSRWQSLVNCGEVDGHSRSAADSDLGELQDPFRLAPCVEIAQRVLAHQKDQLGIRVSRAERIQRIGSVGGSSAIEIDSIDRISRAILERELQHVDAVESVGKWLVRLVGWITRRNDENVVEGKAMPQFGDDHEVPDMHRIERSAKDADSPWRQSRLHAGVPEPGYCDSVQAEQAGWYSTAVPCRRRQANE
jgi:hypothetical protein